VYGLDIIRAVALMFVLISHGQLLLPESFKPYTRIFILDGVTMFFVLSGFLIGGILIKEVENNEVSKKLLIGFWIRRWFRTLPNYFLVLTILGLISNSFLDDFPLKMLAQYYVFVQNLFYPHPTFFTEAWSLSVEEWFYLFTPVLLFACIKYFKIKPKYSLLIVAFAFIAFGTAVRWIRFENLAEISIHNWDLYFRKQVISRIDSIMYGIVVAWLYYYYRAYCMKYKKHFMILGLTILIVSKALSMLGVTGIGRYFHVFWFIETSVATGMVLPFLANLKQGSGMVYKGLTILSLTSYSIYLLHHSLVLQWIVKPLPLASWLGNELLASLIGYALYWIITIGLATLQYKYFEIPMSKLREHPKVLALYAKKAP
jgi:peptidoglycan/LPS O-acetylase OafA/YrhL